MSTGEIERHEANGFIDMPEQDKAFAVEYITNGFKHRKAATEVGFHADAGIRKLRDPLIGAFISHLQSENNVAKLITTQFVEQQYLEILPKLKGEEEVDIVDIKEGASFKAKKFHSAELVSVLSHLGKSSGYIAPDVGPNVGQVNVQINLGDLAGDVEVLVDE
jgi:hypothetical protein